MNKLQKDFKKEVKRNKRRDNMRYNGQLGIKSGRLKKARAHEKIRIKNLRTVIKESSS